MEQLIIDFENTMVGTSGATPQDWVDRFVVWSRDNPEAIKQMHSRALFHAQERGYVSANYLLEWLRYDSGISIKTSSGSTKDFKAPNTFATIFARYIAEDPRIRPAIRLNQSDYDECDFPPIPFLEEEPWIRIR